MIKKILIWLAIVDVFGVLLFVFFAASNRDVAAVGAVIMLGATWAFLVLAGWYLTYYGAKSLYRDFTDKE